MRGYPQFSFRISITLVKIYIPCVIINRGENTIELVGTVINNYVAIIVEVGCLRHPGASTIGSQLQGGDCSDGWQNLTTQPWAPPPPPNAPEKTGTHHTDKQSKIEGGGREVKNH